MKGKKLVRLRHRAYSLLGLIIAVFFASLFLSFATEFYLLMTGTLKDLKSGRAFLEELILTDQILTHLTFQNQISQDWTLGFINTKSKNTSLLILESSKNPGGNKSHGRILMENLVPPPVSKVTQNSDETDLTLQNENGMQIKLNYLKYPGFLNGARFKRG